MSWSNNDTHLWVAMESPETGWVSVGLDPGFAMSEANFVFGYVADGETFVSDQYGSSNFGHTTDISRDGTDDILLFAGSEGDGTVIEFVILLDSGDPNDKALSPGGSYKCLVAFSGSDNFTSKHSGKGSITITLD